MSRMNGKKRHTHTQRVNYLSSASPITAVSSHDPEILVITEYYLRATIFFPLYFHVPSPVLLVLDSVGYHNYKTWRSTPCADNTFVDLSKMLCYASTIIPQNINKSQLAQRPNPTTAALFHYKKSKPLPTASGSHANC